VRRHVERRLSRSQVRSAADLDLSMQRGGLHAAVRLAAAGRAEDGRSRVRAGTAARGRAGRVGRERRLPAWPPPPAGQEPPARESLADKRSEKTKWLLFQANTC